VKGETKDLVGDHPKFLGIAEVAKRIGLCGASIHRMEREGDFPTGFYVTPRRKVWIESEVVTWQMMKIAEARA